MQIAIVGLAGAGKTTVFNTLTRGHAETGGYGGRHAQRRRRQGARRAARPPRRDLQAEEDRPRRRHLRGPAGAASLERGPRRDRGAAGRAPRPAARLRRAAPRRPGVRRPGRTRTRRAASTRRATSNGSTSSSLLADLAMAERRLERLETSGRHGTPAEREANEREEVVVRRIHDGLEAGHADPRRRPRRRRGEGRSAGFRFLTEKPVLVLLNVGEADLGRRTGARRARSPARLRPPARDGRGAVGQDRDGARRARARRGRGVHGRARDRRVRPRPGDRPVVPAARADLVPDRRARTRSAPGRSRTVRPRSTRPGRSTPTWPRASSAPRPSPTRTWSRSARWPRRARPAGSARRARPTGSATATCSRSCSAADARAVEPRRAVESVEVDDDRLVVGVRRRPRRRHRRRHRPRRRRRGRPRVGEEVRPRRSARR